MNTTPAANYCPICGKINRCAMQIELDTGIKQPACWCTSVDFDEALLSQVPAEKLNVACICAECARSQVLQGQSHNGV